jgi:hypothetical protein
MHTWKTIPVQKAKVWRVVTDYKVNIDTNHATGVTSPTKHKNIFIIIIRATHVYSIMTYLASNVVRKPVQTLVKTLS